MDWKMMPLLLQAGPTTGHLDERQFRPHLANVNRFLLNRLFVPVRS